MRHVYLMVLTILPLYSSDASCTPRSHVSFVLAEGTLSRDSCQYLCHKVIFKVPAAM